MEAEFYRWSQDGGADEPEPPAGGYLDLPLSSHSDWDLRAGRRIEKWDPNAIALFDEEAEPPDFPFTSNDLPVFSPRLKALMESLGVEGIQYLPLRIRHQASGREVQGYQLANYLCLIDCLDWDRSVYQLWTKDNLLFWEQRPHMLGTFRDVQKAVLDSSRIGTVPIFRLWGWEVMVVVRGDIKRAVEAAGMTGCWFSALEAS